MSHEPLSEEAGRAARTYSAAADHYLRPALGFWNRWGAATVDRLGLAAPDSVLDLCCGAGASAVPAARAVAPGGSVLGIDLAEPLLALARGRAAEQGVGNVEFQRADATRLEIASGSFDAVVCVFGVFFAPDMAAFVKEMWRLVRPGGRLAVTTWGPGWAEPGSSVFWDCVRALEPSLYRAFNPWDEITTAGALADLLARGGVPDPVIEAAAGEQRLAGPADFWDIVLGSGLRGTVEALDVREREVLRERTVRTLAARGVDTISVDVVFAVANRPRAA